MRRLAEQINRDLRFGIRQMLKHPLFTLVSAVALGLGIGTVTTQFSVINGLFFRGLPFPESNRIAHLERVNVQSENVSADVPLLEFLEWRKQQEAFEGLAGFYNGTVNLTVGDTVERYNGAFISANVFELLRVDAHLGRTLQPADERPDAPDVTVISHRIWTRDFASDPEIIGREAILNGRNATIVGVMPEGFDFPIFEDLWVPLLKQQDPSTLSWGDPGMSLEVMGRLKDGVSYDAAAASMATIARQLEAAYPDTQEGFQAVRVKPFIDEFLGGETRSMTTVMLVITLLILLIACANVANLLLARSMRRQKEVAIRSALGATRNRIVSQFLTESLLLSVVGALIGVGLAIWNIRGLKESTVELNTPFWVNFNLDVRVLVAVAVITLGTGVLSGLVPALRASRLRENEILKDDNRTGSSLHIGRFSRFLVILQIAVAAIVLSLVVLFVRSTRNAMTLDYEYNPDAVMSARIGLFDEVYPDEQSRATFIRTLLSRLEARPEILHAATSSRYRFLGSASVPYELPDRVYENESDRGFAHMQRVSGDFFEAVQLPVLAGRAFYPEEESHEYPRHAVVNRAFAEREWGGLNVVGKRFRPDTAPGDPAFGDLPWVEVVGVCGSMQEKGIFNDEDDGAAFFVPKTVRTYPNFITILVRGSGDPAGLASVLREEVSALDRNLPLYEIGTPRQINDRATAQFGIFASIFTSFGVLATFLAAIGIYGVITFSVDQRLMEFGIRQALGATRAAIFRLVYAHAFRQLGYGFIIALLCLSPLILSPGIRETLTLFFYGAESNSITPYLLSFGFVALIAICSAAPPAYRASRIHPAQALRYE